MARVIAFDVNETLLDLRALDTDFARLLGTPAARGEWFSEMLQLSFVGGLTGRYVDFRTAQHAALRMVAQRRGRSLDDAQITDMVDRMRTLPPHREVPTALARLADTPLTVVALTNSVQDVAEAQLRNAGIDAHFDAVMSADAVRALKPAPAPYLAVAERHGVEIGDVRLVAAHAWDIAGALAAGALAAFVARPGMVLSPLGGFPDIVAPDIATVVERIIERDLAG